MNKDASALWACRRILTSYRSLGSRKTFSLIRENLAERLRQYLNRRFDRKYHVDTSGIVHLGELTCEGDNKTHGVWYEPTPIRTLKCMFSSLPADLSNFTFIDFGSGKGRTILYASNYSFRRVIGVEFAEELHAVAEKNIRTYRSKTQKCFNITSICLDAARFSLPEEQCVLYFFHPFRSEVMAKVLDNIDQSYRRNPRKLVLLYYHPQLHTMLQTRSFLHKTGDTTMPLDLSAVPSPYRRKLEVYETH
jgi:hypothetical protein